MNAPTSWGHLARIVRAAGRAFPRVWRALPGDLLGLGVIGACGVRSGTRRIAVFDGDGGVRSEALLVEDPRLARFLDAVPLRPSAMTLGRYVLARSRLPEATVRHELEHVRQWSSLGPFYLPLYLANSAIVQLLGGDRYRDNWFEAAARARESDDDVPQAVRTDPG